MPRTQIESLDLYTAARGDLAVLHEIMLGMRQDKEPDYFERCFEEQELGNRQIYLAMLAGGLEGKPVGYCILNWNPKYGYFRQGGIPETQDLNVLPAYRQRGYATQMIAYCEEQARARGHSLMGISVGLHARFGPAQRLYYKLGYAPDGFGVTYDRKTVSAGDIRPVDDNLCLMMVRKL